MKKAQTIFQQGNHTWRVIARDPDRPNYLIDTNEYLEIFPSVFAAICAACNPEDIVALFASHQDPDIISSLSLWLEFNADLPCYIPWL
jgi:flavorubredoxin